MYARPRSIGARQVCALVAVGATALLSASHAAGLNDTGQTLCYDGAAMVACTTANTGDGAAYPRQDGRFGRDARADTGSLAKAGGGAAGFDFTRVCMNGDAAGTGTCPASPPANTGASPAATDWACTRDNVTGLVWSMQTIASTDWTDATTTHPAAHNGAGRCGLSTGWRAPTLAELYSLIHFGAIAPAVDTAYFPGVPGGVAVHWTVHAAADAAFLAWGVELEEGRSYRDSKIALHFVRLVRSAP